MPSATADEPLMTRQMQFALGKVQRSRKKLLEELQLLHVDPSAWRAAFVTQAARKLAEALAKFLELVDPADVEDETP